MRYTYAIESEERIGVVTLLGRVDGEQVLAAMATLYADERWQPGLGSLWDAAGVEHLGTPAR